MIRSWLYMLRLRVLRLRGTAYAEPMVWRYGDVVRLVTHRYSHTRLTPAAARELGLRLLAVAGPVPPPDQTRPTAYQNANHANPN